MSFSELGLWAVEEGVIIYLPAPDRKLDLEQAVLYNKITKIRDQAALYLKRCLERDFSRMDLKEKIRVIPDFPQPGISFKDITTLLKDGEALREAIKRIASHFADAEIDMVVGVESRGFILGAPLAYEMGLGFTLIRKPGKLPGEVLSVEYDLEYGTDRMEIHADAFPPGTRVLVVDDLLATGGTIAAAIELIKKLGGQVVGLAFLIELSYLHGRERLEDYHILSLVDYKE